MVPNQLTASLARQDDHDIDQILALNKLEYGADDVLATRADFVWRHDQNPAGQAIIPVIRDRRGDVVGFIWLVPLQIRVKGQDYLAGTGIHLVIQPEYRRTFGYVKLIRRFEQALEDNNIPLHFSFVSEETYRRRLEQDPQTVSTIPLLIKPLNFETLAQAYFNRKWPRFIGKVGWLVSPFFSGKPLLNWNKDITARAIEQFDDSFDEFWCQARDKYPVMVIRNCAFLTWRFAPVSGRRYHILVAQLRDQMLGYTVIRCATVRGVKTGLILDLLVADHPLGIEAGARLMAQAEAFFRTQEVSLAAGLMAPQTTEYQILRQSGYRDLLPAIAPRPFRFAFFIHNTSQEALKLLSIRDWFITLADYESF
jgi:GNAT superfamily N-acetyltransferase